MTLAAGAALCMAAAAPANAGLLVESAADCPAQHLEQPFKRWLDPMQYTLVPGGSFESGAQGWTLSGGASVVSENERFFVRSAADRQSLNLPRGSSAVSAPICVGIEHPTLRFFSESSKSLLSLSTLRVDVIFETSLGHTASLPIGVALPTGNWTPSLPLPVLANLLPLLPGEQTAVAFRFTPQGSASWRIDDVYVDPQRRG